jgi:hypothetical protein
MKNLIKQILTEETQGFSGVIGFLQSFAQMTSGKQKEYYQYMLDNIKKVNVGTYRDDDTLRNSVDDLIENTEIENFCQKKGCFDTAYNATIHLRDLGIKYVEGYVESFIPIAHAWNYYPEKNLYFDLINDVAWSDEDSHFSEYYEIINLDYFDTIESSGITGFAGGFLQDGRYINHLLG